MKEACMMKIAYGDHFLRRITSMYKFDIVVKAIRENLTKPQLQPFKKDIFGYCMESQSSLFSGIIVHNVLLKYVAHGKCNNNYLLWFEIGKHLIHLSIGEWFLVNKLFYSDVALLKNQKIVRRLLNKYFDNGLHNMNFVEFDSRFEDLTVKLPYSKIAFYAFADIVLNGGKYFYQISFSLFDEVDDIDHFQNYSQVICCRKQYMTVLTML